jgi:hypothetical protein
MSDSTSRRNVPRPTTLYRTRLVPGLSMVMVVMMMVMVNRCGKRRSRKRQRQGERK